MALLPGVVGGNIGKSSFGAAVCTIQARKCYIEHLLLVLKDPLYSCLLISRICPPKIDFLIDILWLGDPLSEKVISFTIPKSPMMWSTCKYSVRACAVPECIGLYSLPRAHKYVYTKISGYGVDTQELLYTAL